MRFPRSSAVWIGYAIVLLATVWFGVQRYDHNVSALLHMDSAFGRMYMVPEDVVLYEDGGYDGMLYYQVAREVPAFFSGQPILLDSPYRFQRILLPLLVNAVALGDDDSFPAAFVFLNVSAALLALALMIRLVGASTYALAAVANPAVFVGVLYTLTEPLSLLFVVVFLSLWERAGRKVTPWGVLALVLSLLARETTLFLVVPLTLWYAYRREWLSVAMLAVPLIVFASWQMVLTSLAGSVPIATGGNMIGAPLAGPAMAIVWAFDEVGLQQLYRLSSLALLAFVAGTCVALWNDRRNARHDPAWALLAALVAVMLCMHPHIWGVITSVGRVVTPLYPVYALFAASRDTRFLRWLSVFLIVLSVVAAVGIAAVPHPFIVS